MFSSSSPSRLALAFAHELTLARVLFTLFPDGYHGKRGEANLNQRRDALFGDNVRLAPRVVIFGKPLNQRDSRLQREAERAMLIKQHATNA